MGIVRKDAGKVYIEEVRKVSWDTGEMCEFASSFVSALNNIGESIPYYKVLGSSGVAFRFTINPGEWDFGNYSIRNISPEQYEPVRRAFSSAGYAYKLIECNRYQEDAANIIDSIERGIPVLAFGVVGPSDTCIITGYDDGGEVLLGWSTYQDIPDDHPYPHDSTGYFRKSGWHDATSGYILIGEKMDVPEPRKVYLETLKWAVSLMRMPKMGNKITGLDGLRLWAEEMTQERYFPPEDNDVLGQRYVSAAINMTMLRDHCLAKPFLQQVIDEVPDFQPELSQAIDCYNQVIQLRNSMDLLIADNFAEAAMKAIADPEIRRAYADQILKIRDAEEQAAQRIEHLLLRAK